jgi:endonuclease YncB( thermonuclease family)
MSALDLKRWSALFVAAAACLAAPIGVAVAAEPQATTITGSGQAIGPDIIMVDKQRVILLGIDAPEEGQGCKDGNTVWTCAETAFAVLDQLVKAGPVTCQLIGPPDPFMRRGGICTVDGKDIAGEMVTQGLALPYPHDKQSSLYLDDLKAAQAAKVGLWQPGIVFEKPWEYRHAMHPPGIFK